MQLLQALREDLQLTGNAYLLISADNRVKVLCGSVAAPYRAL